MRAWHVTRNGEPEDVLELVEVDDPTPGAGEVLVRVAAVAANFPDVLLSRGQYQVRPELPFIPGIEFAGRIVAVGPDVTGLQVGQRVVGASIGVLSELAVVPASDVHPTPDALDDIAASGLMIAYQTAWFALHRRARLQEGEWVLVHAAAGGVGAATVQLAVAAGARVIAVVGSDAKAPLVRELGAEAVLVRGVDDIPARVKEITAGHGADVVFDPVGGPAFEASVRCVAFEGRIVVIGFASGEIPTLKTNVALVKNFAVLGLYWALYSQTRPDLVAEAHAELSRLAASGEIRPVVDEVVPFERAPEAIRKLADGRTTGRVVIEVAR
ncbi:NADPH:quinone oxidoreductase family protein [Microbacterium sp. zg.Y1090]|uniref:NADPH:quinone oxidoreductase family protein n=1 Tax=Microbacterium TaxID=33882 RepID=UPI00214C04A6|nr:MULTISPECIES: NADPH:quinone oxidoreductase family protein [unclassified Microbacterium]MCR2813174.1 NADPH:quinone oxidoreductase family protein [Microbacterium sp. zg.Y1084]MCR2819487.1 NADPH:quinone oxidoreductase family protein [Microbacterium sp. zg.Y1090]MDL5487341.1 NADPH:quinone oxidoreductase family protein [Microbacterium sp. zg-Y1211]WIM28460.1 NADPH:quinone oxidoreductase family protein [Microbacterium sp. zg-Y1090]